MTDEVVELSLPKVIRNLALYPRTDVDSDTVDRLVRALEAGEELPPIVVNQKNWLIDGLHRWTAHQRLGRGTIKVVQQSTSSEREFFLAAVAANTAHGKPLSAADALKVVKQAKDLGLESVDIAKALRVPVVKLASVGRVSAASSTTSAKPTFGLAQPRRQPPPHVGGVEAVASDQKLAFYAQQLRAGLGRDGFRVSPRLRTVLAMLSDTLDELLADELLASKTEVEE